MSRYPSRLALALSLVLAGSPLMATSGQRTAPSVRHASSVVRTAALPSLLDRLGQHLIALWGRAGCGADPNGAKCIQSPAATGHSAVIPKDEGCGADPDGLCLGH